MSSQIAPELASILSPYAHQNVIDGYATLAERAKVYNFGLLEDDLVIIDTETTGLDFKECELIEVAAARLRGRDIIDTFDCFIKPQKPIPVEIAALTGITNEMVKDAPCAKIVVEQFMEFAGDTVLVAHNAIFDMHFLKKANDGVQVGDTWIDSLELSRIVLPCLTSHKLHDLSRAFGLHSSTHRALDDVIATCGLWRVLLTAASDLPTGLLTTLANLYPSVAWPYRHIFTQIATLGHPEHFSLYDQRSQCCAHLSLSPREDAYEIEELQPLEYPTQDEITRAFSYTGIVGSMYEAYELRNEQKDMALAVARAFMQHQKVAIEAGTGVGKSIAYLVPAVLLSQKNHITVGIATKTNALTDQIINHELPLLSKNLNTPLTYTALKGYDNYPCMRKLLALLRKGSKTESEDVLDNDRNTCEPSEDLLNAIAALCVFALQSAQGDLNCLGIKWGKLQRSDFTSTAAECQKRQCPFFPHLCYLHLARKLAASSDIVVTNHSLLFRQVGSDIEVLPPIRYWIIDEAHSAEDEARRQWSLTVNSREAASHFEIMGNSHSGVLGILFRAIQKHPATTLLAGLLTKTSSECSRASIASELFFSDLKTLCRKIFVKQQYSNYDSTTMRIDNELRMSPLFARVLESGESLRSILDKAIKTGQEAFKAITEEAQEDAALQGAVEEATIALKGLAEVKNSLDVILKGTDDRYVYAVSATQRTGFEAYELTAQLLNVGNFLAQSWYPEVSSVVYSSATIAVAQKFDHFERSLGLDKLATYEHSVLKLESSYDYHSNMGIVLVSDMPDPAKQRDDYLEALSQLLIDIHISIGGSVLTLFTSRVEMEQCYKTVQGELAQHGLELACQDRSSNVRRIRDHFLAEKTSSLFALKSFWEGFDAPGDTLRCVVIPKLPFSAPTDPLSQERKDREGRDAWKNHDLPEAVLAFKQAAGRLIRSSTDKGCLVLADPRLMSMWYGKVFLQSLPHKANDVIPAREIGDTITKWCNNQTITT
ncbi:MAG: DNA polymerase III subunit epsilon [Coriobacteriales bacterium]|nr:DNA polymerase III subunit epsilon [Coriobacteriales bacterium]